MVKPHAAVKIDPSKSLPTYLADDKTASLFTEPISWDRVEVRKVSTDSATIHFAAKKTGSNATASVHYGTKDCLTFVKRDLHATEKNGLSGELLSDDRVWQQSTSAQPIAAGQQSIDLSDLKPGTTYYFRLLLQSDHGKAWDETTGRFRTLGTSDL